MRYLILILLFSFCSCQTTINNRIDVSSFESKCKYKNLKEFNMNEIDFNLLTKIDSSDFIKLKIDTIYFEGRNNYYYSYQKINQDFVLLTYTDITDGISLNGLIYNISTGDLLSKIELANTFEGCESYWEASSKIENDSIINHYSTYSIEMPIDSLSNKWETTIDSSHIKLKINYKGGIDTLKKENYKYKKVF